ncbi:hypothetical protein VaNZ11_015932, partial [Volvox africanus]
GGCRQPREPAVLACGDAPAAVVPGHAAAAGKGATSIAASRPRRAAAARKPAIVDADSGTDSVQGEVDSGSDSDLLLEDPGPASAVASGAEGDSGPARAGGRARGGLTRRTADGGEGDGAGPTGVRAYKRRKRGDAGQVKPTGTVAEGKGPGRQRRRSSTAPAAGDGDKPTATSATGSRRISGGGAAAAGGAAATDGAEGGSPETSPRRLSAWVRKPAGRGAASGAHNAIATESAGEKELEAADVSTKAKAAAAAVTEEMATGSGAVVADAAVSGSAADVGAVLATGQPSHAAALLPGKAAAGFPAAAAAAAARHNTPMKSDAGLAAAAKPPLPLPAAAAAVKLEPRDMEHPSGAADGAASTLDAAGGSASPEQSPPRPMAVAAAPRPHHVTAARRPAATASLPAKGQGQGGRMAAAGRGSATPGAAARTTLGTGVEGDQGKPHASSAARPSSVPASGTAAKTAGASAPSPAQLPGSGLGGSVGSSSLPQLPQALAPRMNLGRPPTVVTAKLRAAPSAQLPARAVLAAAAASVVQPSASAAIDGAAALASPESPMGEADAAGHGGGGGVGDAGNHRRGGAAPPSNMDAADGPASREAATFSRPGSVPDLRETSFVAAQTVGSAAVDAAGSRQGDELTGSAAGAAVAPPPPAHCGTALGLDSAGYARFLCDLRRGLLLPTLLPFLRLRGSFWLDGQAAFRELSRARMGRRPCEEGDKATGTAAAKRERAVGELRAKLGAWGAERFCTAPPPPPPLAAAAADNVEEEADVPPPLPEATPPGLNGDDGDDANGVSAGHTRPWAHRRTPLFMFSKTSDGNCVQAEGYRTTAGSRMAKPGNAFSAEPPPPPPPLYVADAATGRGPGHHRRAPYAISCFRRGGKSSSSGAAVGGVSGEDGLSEGAGGGSASGDEGGTSSTADGSSGAAAVERCLSLRASSAGAAAAAAACGRPPRPGPPAGAGPAGEPNATAPTGAAAASGPTGPWRPPRVLGQSAAGGAGAAATTSAAGSAGAPSWERTASVERDVASRRRSEPHEPERDRRDRVRDNVVDNELRVGAAGRGGGAGGARSSGAQGGPFTTAAEDVADRDDHEPRDGEAHRDS